MGHCVSEPFGIECSFESFLFLLIAYLRRLSRRHVLYANTQFTCAQFFPTGVQILATGTDRRVSYWEVFDASLVRDVEASKKGPVHCVAFNKTGEHFVSVGSDQIVKVNDQFFRIGRYNSVLSSKKLRSFSCGIIKQER